jgi:hypothetical protein
MPTTANAHDAKRREALIAFAVGLGAAALAILLDRLFHP